MLHKALLIPINDKHEIFIQDRRGYKKPDWGFFGGGMEEGESSMDTVIRESKEELGLSLRSDDLEYIGVFTVNFAEVVAKRHCYLYRTNQEKFTILEGKGGVWLNSKEATVRLDLGERFYELWEKISEMIQ